MYSGYKYEEIIKEDEYKHIKEHTERVVEICREFITALGDQVNDKIIIEAAGFHDIAKTKDNNEQNKQHNEQAGEVIKENNCFSDEALLNDICEVIRVHKGAFNPNKKVAYEAAILRIADKLDKFNKGKHNAENKCSKSLKKIKRYFATEDKLYSQLLEVYECIQSRLTV